MGQGTPTTVEVKIEKKMEIAVNDCIEYTFYINGQEYRQLPLDANVREPNTAKSKPYKDMCLTLQNNPEKFFENNLGISVVASKVEKINDKKYKLFFKSGTGILNGGHTQQAILDCQQYPQSSKAIIKITVREKNYNKTRLAEIAAAQNSSTAVKEYSLAEKKGLFAPIKSCLTSSNEKHIIWFEGRDVPNNIGMSSDDLIALINVFNINLYHSRYNSASSSQPTASSKSKGKVFKKWEDEPNSFYIIYPLVNDILELSDYIRRHFYEGGTNMTSLKVIEEYKTPKKLIFSGEECKYSLPSQFFYPLIAAFRANVYYNADDQKIGWYKSNQNLFDFSKKSLCEKLRSFYRTTYSNNLTKAGSDPMLFEHLYITLQNYIDYNSTPEKTYDIQK